jgi:adenosylcobinamide-GDP ribazoletransferase
MLGVTAAVLLVLPAGTAGLAGVAAAALVAAAFGLAAHRRYGGITGDVLGATSKVAETAALGAAVVVLG